MNSDKLKRELSQNEMLLAVVKTYGERFKRVKELVIGHEFSVSDKDDDDENNRLLDAVINSYETLKMALEGGRESIIHLYDIVMKKDIFEVENKKAVPAKDTEKRPFESYNDGDEYYVISKSGDVESKYFGDCHPDDYGYYMAENMFSSYEEAETRRQKLFDECRYGLYRTILDCDV